MTGPNDAPIERFYGAFARGDGAAMAACYGPEVHFHDPVFLDLHGPEAGAMWQMLTGTARDLSLELGWTPFLRSAVRRRVRASLERFQAHEAASIG